MPRIKKVFTIVAVFASIVFLTGCGQKKNKEADKKILIRWSGYAFPEYDRFRYEQSALFEKVHPDVKVKYEPIPGGFSSKILTQLAGGTAPDIFFVPPYMYYDFIKKGVLTDLTDYIKEDEEFFNQYYPALMDMVDYKGRKYGIVANNDFPVLYFNKAIFDVMKMPYPTNDMTLEDVIDLAKKMAVREPGGKTSQYGLICDNSWWEQLGVLYGGKLWSEDGKTCYLNTEPFKKAFMFIKDIYAVHKVAPFPQEASYMGYREQFIGGRAAMYMGHTWEIATFKIQKRDSGKFDWSLVMLPVPRDGRRTYLCGGNILGVSVKARHQRIAYELVKFMCEPERIKFLIEIGDSVPVRPAGIEMDTLMNSPVHPREVVLNIQKALNYTVPINTVFNASVNADEFDRTVKEELGRYYLMNEDINVTLNNLEKRISSIMTKGLLR